MSARGFLKLLEYAERSRQRARGTLVQGEVLDQWSGIGFRLLGQHFVATMGEVTEVLPIPRYTAVPGVKPWMRGLANVRGRLLPVMDLPHYFQQSSQVPEARRRVLVVDMGDVFSGLIVDEVFGMQHFPVRDYREQASALVARSLQPYLQGAFWREGVDWNIFSLHRLVSEPAFMQAAVA